MKATLFTYLPSSLLLLLLLFQDGSGQRRQFIQEMINELKTKPAKSISPSFNGDIKFDVIGTGDLPLQRPEVPGKPSVNDVITGSISRFATSTFDNFETEQEPNRPYRSPPPPRRAESGQLPFLQEEDEGPNPFSAEETSFSINKDDRNNFGADGFSKPELPVKRPDRRKKPIYSQGPKKDRFSDFKDPKFKPHPLPSFFEPEAPPKRFERPQRLEERPSRLEDGPRKLNEGPGFFNEVPKRFNEGTKRFNAGPQSFSEGPSRFNEGPPRFNEGPLRFNEGPQRFNDGPQRFNEGPQRFNEGPRRFNKGPPPPGFHEGPTRLNGPPSRFQDSGPGFSDGPRLNNGRPVKFGGPGRRYLNGPPQPQFDGPLRPNRGGPPSRGPGLFSGPPGPGPLNPAGRPGQGRPGGQHRPPPAFNQYNNAPRHKRQPHISDLPGKGPAGGRGKQRRRIKGERRKNFKPPATLYNEFEPSFEGSEPFDEEEALTELNHGRPEIPAFYATTTTTPRPTAAPPAAIPAFSSAEAFMESFENSINQRPERGNKNTQQSESAESDNLGFFSGAQESFPDLSEFGVSWEPQKTNSRKKRSALKIKNPFYYRDERRGRRKRPRPRPSRRPSNRRSQGSQGPTGFWDDADFDSDFFNGGGPSTFNSYEDFSQQNSPYIPRGQQPALPPPRQQQQQQPRPQRPPPPPVRQVEPIIYRSQQLQQIQPQQYDGKPTVQKAVDYYANNARKSYYNVEDNEILGSGNFDIVKGGTFYDENDYQYVPTSNNLRPTSYNNYYGGGGSKNDFFQNFRDFADIKEKKNQNVYY